MGTEHAEEVNDDEWVIPYDTEEDFDLMALHNMQQWCEEEPPWDDVWPPR
jgi:hypothetical protein